MINRRLDLLNIWMITSLRDELRETSARTLSMIWRDWYQSEVYSSANPQISATDQTLGIHTQIFAWIISWLQYYVGISEYRSMPGAHDMIEGAIIDNIALTLEMAVCCGRATMKELDQVREIIC